MLKRVQHDGSVLTTFIALLRAVNVGGTGKLSMADLKAMCVDLGFAKVQTYIASGNVVFEAHGTEADIRKALELRLEAYAGKPVGVLIRTAAEITATLAANPFADRAPNRTVAIFLDKAPSANALTTITGQRDEEVKLGLREIYVHYGSGMADTKLKIPAALAGTARNMNTVARLVAMAADLSATTS